MTEPQFQASVIRWLRDKGFWVMKCQTPPAPTGTADVFFCLEGFYGWLECKMPKTRYQALQREFIDKMNEWSWAKVVTPATWPEIQVELEKML